MMKVSTCHCLAIVIYLCMVYSASCQTSLSGQEQRELLAAHNHFRGIVNPTASNMERMVWSAELASVAQNYAEQCIFDHNSQRTSQQNTFTYVGENLFITSSIAVNYTAYVRSWFDERDVYNYQTNECGGVCGHYTQVVWATSNSLGCGAYRCARAVGFSSPNSLILVCNYGPGGNFVGQLPYQSGSSCSACSEGLNFCVSNLCSSTSSTTRVKMAGFSVIFPIISTAMLLTLNLIPM